MKFRTELIPEKIDDTLNLESGIMTLGSCFSDAIGQRLVANKFRVMANPFGTLFNPVSVCKVLVDAVRKEMPSQDRFLERDGEWLCYDYHSDIRAQSLQELKELIRQRQEEVRVFLSQSSRLFLTFGTAWVYYMDDEAVANCHKVPASKFERRRLGVDEIVCLLRECVEVLRDLAPELKVTVTVSPVRHLRDGLVENNLSKSILRTAVGMMEADGLVQYFPAYELVVDDLRDYRFYAKDLAHPNELAEEYVWEKFMNSYLSDDAKAFVVEWSKVRSALAHRPMNERGREYGRFLEKLKCKLEALQSGVDVEEELKSVREKLNLLEADD